MAKRVTELEGRLREHGEVLELIPTMQRQIAYLKGTIKKQKPKKKEEPLVFR